MTFSDCEICGADQWVEVYHGPVRDGVFGIYQDDSKIGRCGGCGVERLAEEACTPESFYESDAYRMKLKQGLDADSYFKTHDELQRHTLEVVWPQNLRSATVADIGCAGGALLDHLRGWTNSQVAIEPYDVYRESLVSRGYHVYPFAHDASCDWADQIDIAFSIQVIEHAENPREFLEQIKPLLKPEGHLVISTPNLRDVLFELLPDDFPSFFYRVVHRWYFDAESLATCARLAGLDVVDVQYVHRYSMSNTLRWLRDRRPTGNGRLNCIQPISDKFWKGYLESTGRSDCLYLILRRAR